MEHNKFDDMKETVSEKMSAAKKAVEDKMAGDRQGQMESDQVQDDGKVRDPNYTGGEYPSNMGHTQNVAGLTGDDTNTEDTESK